MYMSYEPSADVPSNWLYYGTVHSHVDMGAFNSGTDDSDEDYQTGLHITVGRISKEPPEFHARFVVDGRVFQCDLGLAMEEYEHGTLRKDLPIKRWMKKVDPVKHITRSWNKSDWSKNAYGGGYMT